MPVYYVTCFGDRIAGPFESRSEAQRLADEENTNEIGENYDVERADEGAAT
ncbi:hypothetical protein [Salinarchaeum sp. Harcht-Bsk1]|uniref:hypothetical protein n=1 Tax=Salinarchaeum sp. Harcht-Bsk1 TaxID=1333523 RepID=UPI001651A0F8|nr:hypothetical protein [Salinarchaeum sp. Harcht-Bsk1]